MKAVFTATRLENLSLALDPDTGIYDKSAIAEQSRCPDSIYVYPNIQGLRNETLGLLIQAVYFDMIRGTPAVILEGLVDEDQIHPDDPSNPMARRIGMRLQVTRIFDVNRDALVDITAQWIRNDRGGSAPLWRHLGES